MALNWTMLGPNRTPVPLPNEMTIANIDGGIELILRVPDAPPAQAATAGGSGGSKTLKAVGKITVTDKRFIFTSVDEPTLESLSVPLPSILSTKFEQPTFGSNYFTFEIKPAPDGGLTVGSTAEVRFKDGPMFEFVGILEKTRERAIFMKRQETENEEGLPVYTSPTEGSSTSSAGVNTVPVDNPPGYEV
ncbi:hypothetical protein B0H15DRAFT_843345 [Mycena belliarum]|uniref:Uncharacterized protein n=1 Tax=Mycena belliarum TaxID=1033014 RepID=A0AAD6U2B1_9AGAR|nr:hypothetical protein B0H15DRAFT_843345 [Mycena belliae]